MKKAIDKHEITRLTEEYGGQWGINHTRRLIHLISIIGEGEEYNADVVWLAAHLHDWGAYSKWVKPGVDHVSRSREVAAQFLSERGYEKELIDQVLECIEHHHDGDPDRSTESILLSDADALDFLGVVGVLRDFSKNPRELRKAYETAKERREKVPLRILLAKSKDLASKRIELVDQLLSAFEEDTFGYF